MLQIQFDWKKLDTTFWVLRAFRECLGTIMSGMKIEGKVERFDQFLADCNLNGQSCTFDSLEEAKAWVASEIQGYCQEKEILFGVEGSHACERKKTMTFSEILEKLKQGKTVRRSNSRSTYDLTDSDGKLCDTRAITLNLYDFNATDWLVEEE